MTPNTRELKKIGTWLVDGNSGLSSLSMCAVFLGGNPSHLDYPLDPSDLNRCMKFLECVDPSKRYGLLFDLADRNEKWKAILENWNELVKLYKKAVKQTFAHELYDFMQK